MTIDFNELERKLAENKVYNAWQYVQSLCESDLKRTNLNIGGYELDDCVIQF